AAPAPDHGVQEEEQRTRVRLHRPGDVAEDDELARHLLARAVRPVERVAAGTQRSPDEAPDIETVSARVGGAAPRRTLGTQPRDGRHQVPRAFELLRRHLREVLLPQELDRRGTQLERIAVRLLLPLLAGARG